MLQSTMTAHLHHWRMHTTRTNFYFSKWKLLASLPHKNKPAIQPQPHTKYKCAWNDDQVPVEFLFEREVQSKWKYIYNNLTLSITNYKLVRPVGDQAVSLSRRNGQYYRPYCHTLPRGKTYPIPTGYKGWAEEWLYFHQPVSQPATKPPSRQPIL